MKYIIGVDVGGTKIAAGLVYHNSVSKIIKIPTEAHLGKDAVLSNIIKIIKIFNSSKIQSIGLSVAGEIDIHEGVVVSSPNMPKDFKNVPLAKILHKEFQKNIALENDGNCFTVGESAYGAGKKYKIVIGLTLGTGIGSGLVINNMLYSGASGRATEFGHMTIVENGFVCSCGKRGHVEAYGSGNGMIRMFEQFTGRKEDTFTIENMAKDGDSKARSVIRIMSDALGVGIANIINTLEPEAVIIGGGIARIKMLWRPMVARARKEALYNSHTKIKIIHATLKDSAPILGAALVAERANEK